jgi:hydrogenase expression/formation protein HypD
MLVRQVVEGRAVVENQYGRCVNRDGNRKALEVLFDVFEPRDYFEWRGLGSIAHSGMKLSRKYARFDAELKFDVPGLRVADPKACQCGEILKGVKRPWECKVFGTACTPETPIGSCMVSSKARARPTTTSVGSRKSRNAPRRTAEAKTPRVQA